MTTTTKETKQAATAENTASRTTSAKPGMDSYLFNEYPLVIRPELARAVGLNEAIVLQQVNYWCGKNEGRNHNSRDGFTWTYGSYEYWQSQFPWWSVHTVRRVFANLMRSGLLVSRRFNHLPQDRTKWYRVDEDEIRRRVLAKLPDHVSKMDTSCVQNGQLQQSKMGRPLPETNQRQTSETNTNSDEEGEDNHHPSAPEVITFFQENMKVDIIPVIQEELENLVKSFPPDQVVEKIREAALHRVKSPIPYIRKALENERDGKEKEKRPSATDGKFAFKHAPNVLLTESEVLGLVKRFGSPGAEARIDFLSLHIGSTGRNYESDFSTILLWDRRGNPDGTPSDPPAPGWHIKPEWLDSLQPRPAPPKAPAKTGIKATSITLAEWFKLWSEERLKDATVGTQSFYNQTFVTHILPALGDSPLQELTHSWVRRMLDTVPTNRQGFPGRSRIRGALQDCLAGAINKGLLDTNPASRFEYVDSVCKWCGRVFRAQKSQDGRPPSDHCNRIECVDKHQARLREIQPPVVRAN